MIKKNSKYLFLFILVFGILYTYIIIGEEYIRNTYMYINKYYILSNFGWGNNSSSIFLKIVNKETYNNCIVVKKISNYEDKYLIGEVGTDKYAYLDCKKELKYKGYFYINYDNENEAKFNLTKEEIKNKFPGKIKYLKAQKFLNLYGEGDIGQPKEVAIVGIFLWTIIIIFLIIIIKLILKYI